MIVMRSLKGYLSGKGLGHCGIPIMSKVRIPLSANNSLEICASTKPESYFIHMEGVVYMSSEFSRHE
jgi:hypothetical protein